MNVVAAALLMVAVSSLRATEPPRNTLQTPDDTSKTLVESLGNRTGDTQGYSATVSDLPPIVDEIDVVEGEEEEKQEEESTQR